MFHFLRGGAWQKTNFLSGYIVAARIHCALIRVLGCLAAALVVLSVAVAPPHGLKHVKNEFVLVMGDVEEVLLRQEHVLLAAAAVVVVEVALAGEDDEVLQSAVSSCLDGRTTLQRTGPIQYPVQYSSF